MSTQSELKENILAHKVEGLAAWAMENRGPVLTAAGIIVGAALISSVFVLRAREKKDEGWTRLAIAQSLIGQRQYDRGYAALQDLRGTLTDNTLIAQTDFYEGVAALGLKNFDEASKSFSEAVDRSAGTPLRPLAISNLGFALEQKKDFAAAAGAYGRFMSEYGEHFLAPGVQLGLGRSLAADGKTEDAMKALGQLIDLYPTSHWAENARSIMDKYKSR